MKLIKIIKKNYKIEKIIILDQINNKFIHVYGDNFLYAVVQFNLHFF